MKRYKKPGDRKVTGLKDGTRVMKHDVRIQLMGELDEVNSHIGLVRSLTQDKLLWQELLEIQRVILTIKQGTQERTGSQQRNLSDSQVRDFEEKIDTLRKRLPQEEGEILPGGSFYSAQLDIARDVVRRCERRFVEAAARYPMDEQAQAYLDDLSDYLYIQARLADAAQQAPAIPDTPAKPTETVQPAAVTAASPVEKIPALCRDRVANRIKKFTAKVNNSYGTFYTISVVDDQGELLATNSLAKHSVQVHGSQSAAKEALHRAKQQGETEGHILKGGTALYENGYLVGAVGIYGGNEKATNEKVQLAAELLKGAVQR
jgi:ATP:cob(I)alamin adenosyltransferase